MVLTQHGTNLGRWDSDIQFPYHYGSYATILMPENFKASIFVSIPLWFLRNKMDGSFLSAHFEKFPYHYGSYATDL